MHRIPPKKLNELVFQKNQIWICEWDFVEEKHTLRYAHAPFKKFAKLVEQNNLFLPSEPVEYGDTTKLAGEIYSFLYKYVEYPDNYRKLDVWYAFLTWIYELFPVLPYRRAFGEKFGQGKSRWADTLGSICRRGYKMGAVVTPATVFRLSDLMRGTQIIDETEFDIRSRVGDAIMLVLNAGYSSSGGVIWRTIGGTPTPFNCYSPKLIAARTRFANPATESRTITHLAYETDRKDIPPLLLDEFYEESLEIRNKLLMWKFRNYITPVFDEEFKSLKINPRVKEIILPLATVTRDEEAKISLKELALKLSEDIYENRSLSVEAEIVKQLMARYKLGDDPLRVGDIAQSVRWRIRDEDERQAGRFTDKYCGLIIRKRLGLRTGRKRIKGYTSIPYCVICTVKELETLCKVYGLLDEDVRPVYDLLKRKRGREE